jgi:hypothetical protein
VQEATDAVDQPLQHRPVDLIGAAEVVPHLRARRARFGVAFVVGQRDVRHLRPVAVAPLRLP